MCCQTDKFVFGRNISMKRKILFLFISHVALHKLVSPKTIAYWVVETLERSGINTATFRAHSTHSASTSSARWKILSLTEIAKTAGWTNFSKSGKFCNKSVNDINFGQTF